MPKGTSQAKAMLNSQSIALNLETSLRRVLLMYFENFVQTFFERVWGQSEVMG